MRTKLTACALIAAIAVTGCANMTEKQKTTTTGAGIGAVAGAAIGALTGPGGWGVRQSELPSVVCSVVAVVTCGVITWKNRNRKWKLQHRVPVSKSFRPKTT